MKKNIDNNLLKYKKKFRNDFSEIIKENLPDLNIARQRHKKNVDEAKRKMLIIPVLGIIALLVIFIMEYFFGLKDSELLHAIRTFFIFITCPILSVMMCIGVLPVIEMERFGYHNKIKRNIYPKILEIFGNIHYVTGSKTRRIIGDLLGKDFCFSDTEKIQSYEETENVSQISDAMIKESLLIKPYDTRFGQDHLYGSYNDVGIKFNEIELTKNEKSVFNGIALSFKLNKEIKNHVIIMSKNWKYKAPKNFEKVEIEYNKFSSKYNVYVSGNYSAEAQIEARYFLNTAFIRRFMLLKTCFEVSQLACSAHGNELLIMLSTRKDLFEIDELLPDAGDIKQYERMFNEFASVLSFIEVLNLSSRTKL